MKRNSPCLQVVVCLVAACLTAGPLLQARVEPTRGFNIFSQDEEVQLGKQNAAEVTKQMPVLPDSDPVVQYVQKLGARLAAKAPGYQWPYNFHVVNVKEINAFALPGGPIFVNLGTIQAADNEAQLAGVMSHEISHVVQRHGTRAASKQMGAQLPLAILGGIMGESSLAKAAELGITFGVGSYFLKNSRRSESEADLLGTDVMYDAGFEPRQMAVFFEKLEKEMGSSANSMINQFMSDHPNPENRAQAVSVEVKTLMARSYSGGQQRLQECEDASGRHEADDIGESGGCAKARWRSECSGIEWNGCDAEREFEGIRSQGISDFVSRELESFWRSSSNVTIAPQSGVSQNAVSYGAIDCELPAGREGREPGRGDERVVGVAEAVQSDLKQIGNSETIRVNGVAGKSVDLIERLLLKMRRGKR